MQNESLGNADDLATSVRHGVHLDPYEVVVHMPGWSFPIGKATPFSCVEKAGPHPWLQLSFEHMQLSQPAAFWLLQGMLIGDLFRGCSFFSPKEEQAGDFLFLQGTLTPPYSAPLCLENVVLGRLHGNPTDVSRDYIYAMMLKGILFP